MGISNNGSVCPRCGQPKIVGVEVRGVYDGVLYWTCLDCRNKFHRFDRTDPIRIKAAPYVKENSNVE